MPMRACRRPLTCLLVSCRGATNYITGKGVLALDLASLIRFLLGFFGKGIQVLAGGFAFTFGWLPLRLPERGRSSARRSSVRSALAGDWLSDAINVLNNSHLFWERSKRILITEFCVGQKLIVLSFFPFTFYFQLVFMTIIKKIKGKKANRFT